MTLYAEIYPLYLIENFEKIDFSADLWDSNAEILKIVERVITLLRSLAGLWVIGIIIPAAFSLLYTLPTL